MSDAGPELELDPKSNNPEKVHVLPETRHCTCISQPAATTSKRPMLATSRLVSNQTTATPPSPQPQGPDAMLQAFCELVRVEIASVSKDRGNIKSSALRIGRRITPALLASHQRLFDMLTVEFGLVGAPANIASTFVFSQPLTCDGLRSILWRVQLMRSTSLWDVRFAELCEYKARHGTARIPDTWAGNPELAAWAQRQRQFLRLFEQNPSDNNIHITNEQLTKLKKLGFVWRTLAPQPEKPAAAHTAAQAIWEQRFEELKLYFTAHGHFRVPHGYEPSPALAFWCQGQKRYTKFHLLDPESAAGGRITSAQIDRLSALGFYGQPPAAQQQMPQAQTIVGSIETVDEAETYDAFPIDEYLNDDAFPPASSKGPDKKKRKPVHAIVT
eukprot:COSAG05_NODE_287_length_12131_cov_3.148022_10_plen_386_part_00